MLRLPRIKMRQSSPFASFSSVFSHSVPFRDASKLATFIAAQHGYLDVEA
jgi:hypothetical protein